MKKFLLNIFAFFLIVGAILIIIILSPTTYSASQSLLFSSIKKDSLLQNTPRPRVILVGGSSLAYGITSELMMDSLKMNVINNGIHAGLGLKYMLDSTEPYLKAGDIYIIAPEYEQYYDDATYGSEQLLRMVLDVSISNAKLLDWKQIKQISQFIPQYLKSKLQISSYYKESVTYAYRHTAFNKYGDASSHWLSGSRVAYGYSKPNKDSEFNNETLNYLVSHIKMLEERGVVVFVSFPGIQDISAINHNERMNKVYNELNAQQIPLLGKPDDFIIADTLTYDTYYHLTYNGTVVRSKLLVDLIKSKLADIKTE